MERTAGSTSSTEPDRVPAARTTASAGTPERVVLGRIRGAHGLRGQLRVAWFGEASDALDGLSRVSLAGDETESDAAWYEVERVAEGRPGEVRMRLVGVNDRDAAEALRGQLVLVDPAQLGTLPEGEYYRYQLVGCRVEASDGRALGTVREIWSTGAPDVLVIETDDGREHLVPAVGEFLREVDVEARRVVIEVIPGLLDG